MDSTDQSQHLYFDLAEYTDGSAFSSWRYTNEPSRFDDDPFGMDGAMSLSMDETNSSQNSTDSYDEFPLMAAPFDEFAHQMNTGLTFDSHENPPNAMALRQPRCPFSRNFKLEDFKLEPGVPRPISSTETDYSVEDEPRYVCQECNKLFRNLQELDQHTKRVPHKAWRCAEPSCGKTYARRDTFLRHRATHKGKSHACFVCSLYNKQKFFKRKDHLKEHIRNCHSKVVEATSDDNTRSSGGSVSITGADLGGKCETEAGTVKGEECKQAMEVVVKSLHAVMGNDEKDIIGQLGYSLTTLSGPQMKSVASSMARAALETTRETSERRSSGT